MDKGNLHPKPARVIPILRMPIHMAPQIARVVDLEPGSGRWTQNRKHLIALVKKDEGR